jgi:predicted small metal-binding protein
LLRGGAPDIFPCGYKYKGENEMSDQNRYQYEVERELYGHMEEEHSWTEHEKMIELENGEENEY